MRLRARILEDDIQRLPIKATGAIPTTLADAKLARICHFDGNMRLLTVVHYSSLIPVDERRDYSNSPITVYVEDALHLSNEH